MIDTNEENIKCYLLGELSEAERAALEKEYFSDSRVLDRVVQVEHDLVDDYARGRLAKPARQRFEEYYLAHPDRRERAKFAGALAAKLSASEVDSGTTTTTSFWQTLQAMVRGWNPALAFSASLIILLSATVIWLWIQNKELREKISQDQSTLAAQEKRQAELQQKLDQEQAGNNELVGGAPNATTPSPQPSGGPSPSLPRSVSLVLALSGVRGIEGPAPTLTVPADTEEVHLHVSLQDSDYPRYDAVLKRVGGDAVFIRKSLRPVNTKSGAAFTLAVPTTRLTTGDYMLTVTGIRPNGDAEDVSKSLLHLERE